MARHATALKLVDLPALDAFAAEPAVQAAPAEATADTPRPRPVWLLRGMFGVNLSLWLGIVLTIRTML